MKSVAFSVVEALSVVDTSPGVFSVALGRCEPETPVAWDKDGKVVSVYGDNVWDYSAWADRTERVTFNRGNVLSPEDISLLKRLYILALFGPKSLALRTVRYAFYTLQELAEYAVGTGVRFSEITTKQHLVAGYLKTTNNPPAKVTHLKIFFRLAQFNEEVVGWTPPPISILGSQGKDDQAVKQTLYIPSAVYERVLDDSIAALEEFLSLKRNLRDFCIWLDSHCEFFWAQPGALDKTVKPLNNRRFGETFIQDKLDEFALSAWVRRVTDFQAKLNFQHFAAAIRGVRQAAMVVISATTFMRLGEIQSIKANGLFKDYDERIGPIFYVRGRTTKTKKIRNAIWTTSPDSELAFKACREINELWFTYFYKNEHRDDVLGQLGSLPLFVQLPTAMQASNPLSNLRPDETIGRFYGSYLAVFIENALTLPRDSIDEILAVNMTYDRDEVDQWTAFPLAHHQFRRTGLIRAAASGMVSHPSLTYQAKHSDPKHTSYYQNNYLESLIESDDRLDDPLRKLTVEFDETLDSEFEAAYFEALMHSHTDMKTDLSRFFSPYGERHQENILNELEILSWPEFRRREKVKTAKRTLLGACLKDGFCEYGTAESVKGCVHHEGHKPCANAVYDTEKRLLIKQHGEDVQRELEQLPDGIEHELIRASLTADFEAARKAVKQIDSFLEAE